MYLRLRTILCGLLWTAPILAQVTSEDLPSCALDCFETAPPSNASSPSCSLDPNKDFEETFSPCFYSACSVHDALTALNVTSIICDRPVRDITWAIRGFVLASTTIASGVIGLRVLYKTRGLAGGIGWDDYTIVIGVVVTMVAAIGQFLAAWYGMGRDQWKVPTEDITKVYKCFFIAAVGYKLGNAATRVSLLCFYLRIFGKGSAQNTVMACIVLTIIIGITFALADALQCQPVWSFWEGWDGELSGHCGSLSAISWAHSIFNIVLDVATLGIAFWMVHKLHMRWKRKAAVIAMFLLGSAITLVSFLRLQALPQLSNTRNRTWNLAPVSYWSAIEMFAGMVCACLPALRKLGDTMCGSGRSGTRTATNGYERQASDQRPSKVRTTDPTLTFSENDDLEANPTTRDRNVDTEMGVLTERKDDVSITTETHQAPWDATKGNS
ncbi:hypothetical protein JX266_013331 [Neoarthrinium moseri]|nr:hypothetical protein JX266_013331 [Neoarthrinium moseri]